MRGFMSYLNAKVMQESPCPYSMQVGAVTCYCLAIYEILFYLVND